MVDGAWRNSHLKHFVKFARGEEPSFFEMIRDIREALATWGE